jgi:hypothetical protein
MCSGGPPNSIMMRHDAYYYCIQSLPVAVLCQHMLQLSRGKPFIKYMWHGRQSWSPCHMVGLCCVRCHSVGRKPGIVCQNGMANFPHLGWRPFSEAGLLAESLCSCHAGSLRGYGLFRQLTGCH